MKSGVYEILNLVNGKRYVGSAVNFSRRWTGHRTDLRKDGHHCIALQRAWNKYGESAFLFRVIVECPPDQLISKEQEQIDLAAEYNVCRFAGSALGVKHSEETRKKMSARLMGNTHTRGRKYSREICERMAAPKRGRKLPPFTEEHRRNISIAKRGHKGCVGRILSDSTKEKIRQANLGKKKTLEARRKRCVLTDDQVMEIRQMRNDGQSYAAISNAFGISRQSANRVCLKQRYEWVAPDMSVRSFRTKGWKVIGRKRKAA
jgi:group I intron endonuclease